MKQNIKVSQAAFLGSFTGALTLVGAFFNSTNAYANSTNANSPMANFNANNCEFFVDGIASIYTYNQAWSRRILHSEIVAINPAIQRMGQWIRYRDTATGDTLTTEVFASRDTSFVFLAPNKWAIDFPYSGANFPNPGDNSPRSFALDIIDFAFFAEVSVSNGGTIRLWISDNGNNFSFDETFSPPTYISGLGRGSITWTSQNRNAFHQKEKCDHVITEHARGN